uniref:Non-structural maintenance of chromosomes element 4 n=1 Tax=Mola mola TaxID=94237 RepID=A0A3Q3W6F2_MOLML
DSSQQRPSRSCPGPNGARERSTTRACGGKSGASTGTSSPRCSVSDRRDRQSFPVVVHVLTDCPLAFSENREDMLSPSNNKLTEVLEEANKLFKDVRQAREAALDAQLLVVATDLGKEKATQMFAEGNAFNPTIFAERLLSFMGLNRLEDGEDEQQNGHAADGYLPQDAWHRLARRAESCFSTAPSFHYMIGSFHAEPPPPKQRTERQRKTTSKEVKRMMPTQLKKMDDSHHEATEKEVERILGYLKSYYQDDPSSPISYYEFIIDPNSFSRTVENIFHMSFLIRVSLSHCELVCPLVAMSRSDGAVCVDRMELIDAFEIREAMIQTANTQNE